MKTLQERFDEIDHDEHLKFERVTEKLASRPDVHLFVMLDKIFPSENERDIVSATDHYGIFLSIDDEQLETLTDEQLLTIVRCGFSLSEYGGLYSFV